MGEVFISFSTHDISIAILDKVGNELLFSLGMVLMSSFVNTD